MSLHRCPSICFPKSRPVQLTRTAPAAPPRSPQGCKTLPSLTATPATPPPLPLSPPPSTCWNRGLLALPAHNNAPRTGTWTTRSASTLYAHRSPPDALLRLRSLLSLLLLLMLCLDILNSL